MRKLGKRFHALFRNRHVADAERFESVKPNEHFEPLIGERHAPKVQLGQLRKRVETLERFLSGEVPQSDSLYVGEVVVTDENPQPTSDDTSTRFRQFQSHCDVAAEAPDFIGSSLLSTRAVEFASRESKDDAEYSDKYEQRQ